MNKTTLTRVEDIPPISREEGGRLAETENRRAHEQLASLDDQEWGKPTECTLWDVRAMAAHVLGSMEGFSSIRELAHQMRGAGKAKGDGPMVDGLTSVQVGDRASLSQHELLDRLAAAGPRAARSRAKVPAPLRRMTMTEEVDGVKEKWRFGYLLDVILTRDTWMHRVDIARATGREMVLTADHDGRIVADVVAECARRHGEPFTLHLEGDAGGTFVHGGGGGAAEGEEMA